MAEKVYRIKPLVWKERGSLGPFAYGFDGIYERLSDGRVYFTSESGEIEEQPIDGSADANNESRLVAAGVVEEVEK